MIYLIVGLICGAIAAAIAASKGRSAIGWFFFGFFFGLIAVIVAAIMSNKKEEERLRAHAAAERRRLREQLRQEKMKTEAFRQHATHRLDAHDRTLGLDTRRTPALGGAPRQPVLADQSPPPLRPAVVEAPWYYEVDGQATGPVPQSTLRRLLSEGSITGETLVWRDGLADWAPAYSIEGLGIAGA